MYQLLRRFVINTFWRDPHKALWRKKPLWGCRWRVSAAACSHNHYSNRILAITISPVPSETWFSIQIIPEETSQNSVPLWHQEFTPLSSEMMNWSSETKSNVSYLSQESMSPCSVTGLEIGTSAFWFSWCKATWGAHWYSAIWGKKQKLIW